MSDLAARVRAGDRLALARALSMVENREAAAEPLLDALHPHLTGAPRLGLTGPPGSGKSTLAAVIAGVVRAEGATVGIVAVDPTSPFTGGALLGDRIRMQGHAADPGVYVRSMASRGSIGGLAAAADEALDVMDAAGRAYLIVETVGVGQCEIEVAAVADTIAVVLTPEAGDTVQAMKSGLMEIADLLVVNKADRAGADAFVAGLEAALDLRESLPADRAWRPPIVRTVASTGEGAAEVRAAAGRHREHLEASGELAVRRRRRVRERIRRVVERRLVRRLWAERDADLEAWVERVHQGAASPYAAAKELLTAVPRRGNAG